MEVRYSLECLSMNISRRSNRSEIISRGTSSLTSLFALSGLNCENMRQHRNISIPGVAHVLGRPATELSEICQHRGQNRESFERSFRATPMSDDRFLENKPFLGSERVPCVDLDGDRDNERPTEESPRTGQKWPGAGRKLGIFTAVARSERARCSSPRPFIR
jgi:hypothetical protein